MTLTKRTVKDNWYAVLDGGIDAVVTSLVIDGAGAGSEPATPFYMDIDNEQLECTAVSTDDPSTGKSTLTVVRARNGTSAATHADNAAVQQQIYAAQINEIADAVDALESGATTPVINLNWSAWIPATAMYAAGGSPALASINIRSTEITIPAWAFDKDSLESVGATLALPQDYDGRALVFRYYWTAQAGTSGNVVWRVYPATFDDDEAMDAAVTARDVTDAFIAQEDMHVIATSANIPKGGDGDILTVVFYRLANSGSDTFDADALLLGVKVSYS